MGLKIWGKSPLIEFGRMGDCFFAFSKEGSVGSWNQVGSYNDGRVVRRQYGVILLKIGGYRRMYMRHKITKI